MPNHCENQIQIFSNKGLKPIRKLIVNEDKSHTQLIDFNLLVPQPDDVEWYSWCCDNWGTKWNAYDCEILQDVDVYDDVLEIKFTTAWGCPEAWIRKLVEKVLEHDSEASVCGFYRIESYEAAGVWNDDDFRECNRGRGKEAQHA